MIHRFASSVAAILAFIIASSVIGAPDQQLHAALPSAGLALEFEPGNTDVLGLLLPESKAGEVVSNEHLARLAAMQDDAAPLSDDDLDASIAFGAEGTRRFNIMAGGGFDVKHSEDHLAQAGVGISWFFVDNLSLDLELNAMYFDERDEDIYGANFNLLFRWHFVARDTWSIYLDGGAGLLGTTDDVPFNGSSFNFTPQAGIGFTYQVAQDVRLMAGLRWHHVSNANTYEENPGMDSAMIYAGLSFGF